MPGLREVLVSFGMEVNPADEQKVTSSLDKVTGLAKKAVAAFAAFKVGQLAASFVDGIRNMGDELDKTSIQLGFTTAELQALRHAANLAGVDGSAFSDSLGRLQKNAFEASRGNKKLSEDFAALGVNVTDAGGKLKSADQLLMEMADGFVGLSNESEKVALSLNLMGRTGRRLLPLFTTGAEGLKAARDETKRLGVGITQDVIDKSVILTDNQARMQLALLSLKNLLAQQLIPAFNEWALAVTEVAVAVRAPLRRAIAGLQTIIRGLETGLSFVTDRFGTLGKTILGVGAALAALGAAFAITGKTGFLAGVKAAAGWVLATAPALLMIALMGVIIATIVLLIEDFQKMGEGAKSVSGTIAQGFQELVDELGSVPAAIDEMLKTAVGFWLRHFQEMLGISDETLANVEATFGRLTQTTIEFWAGLKQRIVDAFNGIVDAIDGYVQAIKDAASAFSDWVDEHATGIRLVTSLVIGLAGTIAVQYARANSLALVSFFKLQVGALAATKTISLSSIAAAATSAGAWIANAAAMGLAWIQVAAMAVAEFLVMGAVAVASAVASAGAWLAATLPIILTTALIGTLIGLVIWLGVELVKLLQGEENFFSTMAGGIKDLIAQWGGIGPAIGAMLDEALRYWLKFFGMTEGEVDGFVENLTDTLMTFWDNVIDYWGGLFGRFIDGVVDRFKGIAGFFGGLFSGEPEEAEERMPVPAPPQQQKGTAAPPGAPPIVPRRAPAPMEPIAAGREPAGTVAARAAARAPARTPARARAGERTVTRERITERIVQAAPAAAIPVGTEPMPGRTRTPTVQAERAAQERAVIASGAAPEAPVFDALEAGASGATLVKRLIEGAKTLQMISPAAATTMTPGAAIATPRAAAAGPVVTNSPTTNIDVTVDAQGQERPADIAEQVARQVDTVLERRDRQMIQSFATAVAGGG